MSSAFGTTDSFTVIQLGQWIVVSLRPRTLDAAQIFRVAAFDIGDLDDHLVLLAIALEAGALPESVADCWEKQRRQEWLSSLRGVR